MISGFFGLVFGLISALIALVCAAWAFVDANDRGKQGVMAILVALVVLCTFPVGLILWLIFRPEVTGRGGV